MHGGAACEPSYAASFDLGELNYVEGGVVPDIESHNAQPPLFDKGREVKKSRTDPEAHHIADQILTVCSIVLAEQTLQSTCRKSEGQTL